MGQYHYVMNLDKKQFLHPHKFGDGLKLMEFGMSAQGTMTALALLLAQTNGRGGGDWRGEDPEELVGSWAGDRIAIIGDYDDSGVYAQADEDERRRNGLIELVEGAKQEPISGLWEDISYKALGLMLEDGYFRRQFTDFTEEMEKAKKDGNHDWISYQIGRNKELWEAARPGEPWPGTQPAAK